MKSRCAPSIGIRSRIRDLRGDRKSFAEEIAEELSENYGFRVSTNNSIYSLVTLSKKLNKRSKKDRQLLEKMEELAIMCAAASGQAKDIPQEVSDRETRAKNAAPRVRHREALAESLIENERQKRIPATISSINLSAVAKGEKEETEKFRKAVNFLMEYFPENERVPFDNFMEAAKNSQSGKYGDDPGNRYSLIVANTPEGELVGAYSAIYMNKAAAGFGGFNRVAESVQGKGIFKSLAGEARSFFQDSAKENGKELKYLCGEIEYPWSCPDREEAVKRRVAFNRTGRTEVDPRTGFEYFQPDEAGGTRLSLMITSIGGAKAIGRTELLSLTRAIYGTIYRNVPEKIREEFLEKTAASIKMDIVPLMPVATGKPEKKTENEKLNIKDFTNYVGNDREFRSLLKAYEAVDAFIEIRDPKDKSVFNPKNAQQVYEYCFPNPDEAESWTKNILPRLKDMANLADSPELQKKYGDSRFHSVVAVSKGDVVGYMQMSTLPLKDGGVAVFGQYRAVADSEFMKKKYKREENFRQEGMASVFSVFRHGMADQDAREMGRTGVVGMIGETEMIGQAATPDDIRFTRKRLGIHRQMGAKAMLLEMEDGSLMSPQMQPRLNQDSKPIILHMIYRPVDFNDEEGKVTTEMDKNLAQQLVMTYIDNFDREGFDAKDVDDVRKILQERFARAKRVLLVPPENLPNIVELARMDPLLREQVEREYGSLEAHEKKIKEALAVEKEPKRILGS